MEKIQIKLKRKNNGILFPKKQSHGSSGYDIFYSNNKDVVIGKGKIKLIETGIYLEIPYGYEGQVRPRSGLTLKHGITVLNSPGTIDSDYRGELKIILINLGEEDFIIEKGFRIAQLVFTKINEVELVESLSLNETERGEGGFGSTGI